MPSFPMLLRLYISWEGNWWVYVILWHHFFLRNHDIVLSLFYMVISLCLDFNLVSFHAWKKIDWSITDVMSNQKLGAPAGFFYKSNDNAGSKLGHYCCCSNKNSDCNVHPDNTCSRNSQKNELPLVWGNNNVKTLWCVHVNGYS